MLAAVCKIREVIHSASDQTWFPTSLALSFSILCFHTLGFHGTASCQPQVAWDWGRANESAKQIVRGTIMPFSRWPSKSWKGLLTSAMACRGPLSLPPHAGRWALGDGRWAVKKGSGSSKLPELAMNALQGIDVSGVVMKPRQPCTHAVDMSCRRPQQRIQTTLLCVDTCQGDVSH